MKRRRHEARDLLLSRFLACLALAACARASGGAARNEPQRNAVGLPADEDLGRREVDYHSKYELKR